MTRAGKLSLAAFSVLVCLLAPRDGAGAVGQLDAFRSGDGCASAGMPGATVTVTNTATRPPHDAVRRERQLSLRRAAAGHLQAERGAGRLPHRGHENVAAARRLAVHARCDARRRLARRDRAGRRRNPVLNTTDASLGNVISGNQIRALPLEGRNVVGLLACRRASSTSRRPNPSTTMDPRYGSVSGARADQSNVTLDGIDVNDSQNQNAFTSVLRVTLDSVQEFRVTTSNYGADQGRSSGAQVSLVTRSGTNTFSGAGYYVNRDTKFSSNEYFLKLSQLARRRTRASRRSSTRTSTAVAVGGPIRKDKLFFFGNFEGLNEKRETVGRRARVPSNTLARRRADLSVRGRRGVPGRQRAGLHRHAHRPGRLLRPDARRAATHRSARHRAEPRSRREYFKQLSRRPTSPAATPATSTASASPRRSRTSSAPTSRACDYRAQRQPQRSSGASTSRTTRCRTRRSIPGTPSPTRTHRRRTGAWRSAGTASLGPNLVNTFRYGYTPIDSDTIGLQTRQRRPTSGSSTSFDARRRRPTAASSARTTSSTISRGSRASTR